MSDSPTDGPPVLQAPAETSGSAALTDSQPAVAAPDTSLHHGSPSVARRAAARSDARVTRRQGVALAVAAALTLAGAAYSVSTLDDRQALAARSTSTSRAPGSASATPSTSPTSPTSPSTEAPSAASAGTSKGTSDALLEPPATWERIPDATAKTGRVDLARAVAIDGHGALSRTGLTQLGFVSGLSRAWQSGGAALLVLDYTFRDAKGATGFVTYGRRARDADPGFRRTSVTGIPGAAGYETLSASNGTEVVIFARGRRAYIVGVQGTAPSGAAGDLNALARQQYEAAAG